MAKGKKKGGGKDGKEKRPKKEKKPSEPQITLKEAMLAFRLKVKERAIEEYQEEVDALEFKNERQQDRNRKLRVEQDEHLVRLYAQVDEYDEALRKRPIVDKKSVEEAMLKMYADERIVIAEIEAAKLEAIRLQEVIDRTKAGIQAMEVYEQNTKQENEDKIAALKIEMESYEVGTAALAGQVEMRLKSAEVGAKRKLKHAEKLRDTNTKKLILAALPPEMQAEVDATSALLDREQNAGHADSLWRCLMSVLQKTID